MTKKEVVYWKIEAVTIIFIVICISISFYLVFLSFQILDELLRKQLVTFAASFLITGIAIFATLTVYLGIKRAFKEQKT
ncbi:hypothetical protein KAU85_01720 [Candidatus Bathyarchaeota archaeon]|nr:hypothetical protein [Candidatus Bathyarchaeota archaeon]